MVTTRCLLLLLSLLLFPHSTAFTPGTLLWKHRTGYVSSRGLANSFDSDDVRVFREDGTVREPQQQPRRVMIAVDDDDNSASQRRTILQMQKFTRLPFWPAWNGVFIFLISKLLGDEAGAKLEDSIGGRVCPNFYSSDRLSSPFLMLVHHRHSFAPWDPLRLLQSSFFPEGFPAHPHRGTLSKDSVVNSLFTDINSRLGQCVVFFRLYHCHLLPERRFCPP